MRIVLMVLLLTSGIWMGPYVARADTLGDGLVDLAAKANQRSDHCVRVSPYAACFDPLSRRLFIQGDAVSIDGRQVSVTYVIVPVGRQSATVNIVTDEPVSKSYTLEFWSTLAKEHLPDIVEKLNNADQRESHRPSASSRLLAGSFSFLYTISHVPPAQANSFACSVSSVFS